MTVLNSSINVHDSQFKANSEAMASLVADLNDKVAQLAQGGGEALIARQYGPLCPCNNTSILASQPATWVVLRSGFLRGWRLVGVCQHQRLRSCATRLSARANDVILRWTGASIRHPSGCVRATKTHSTQLTHRLVRLPLGGVRMAPNLATNRLPLAIRRIYCAGYRDGGMGTGDRCSWGVMAYCGHGVGSGRNYGR